MYFVILGFSTCSVTNGLIAPLLDRKEATWTIGGASKSNWDNRSGDLIQLEGFNPATLMDSSTMVGEAIVGIGMG
jgi:hypothetical protein